MKNKMSWEEYKAKEEEIANSYRAIRKTHSDKREIINIGLQVRRDRYQHNATKREENERVGELMISDWKKERYEINRCERLEQDRLYDKYHEATRK